MIKTPRDSFFLLILWIVKGGLNFLSPLTIIKGLLWFLPYREWFLFFSFFFACDAFSLKKQEDWASVVIIWISSWHLLFNLVFTEILPLVAFIVSSSFYVCMCSLWKYFGISILSPVEHGKNLRPGEFI